MGLRPGRLVQIRALSVGGVISGCGRSLRGPHARAISVTACRRFCGGERESERSRLLSIDHAHTRRPTRTYTHTHTHVRTAGRTRTQCDAAAGVVVRSVFGATGGGGVRRPTWRPATRGAVARDTRARDVFGGAAAAAATGVDACSGGPAGNCHPFARPRRRRSVAST